MQSQFTNTVFSASRSGHFAFRGRAALLGATLLLALSTCALAAENAAIVTDRPGYADSSQVVGKSRFQVESSVAVERDNNDSIKYRTFSTPFLLRYGVSDTVEIRYESDGRLVQRARDSLTGFSQTERGYADSTLGLKWHFMDQRGNAPSSALLLNADLGTGSKQFRGEGVRPFAKVAMEWDLPADYSIGITPGIGLDRNESGGHFANAQFNISLGKSLTDRLHGFIEVASPRIAKARNGGTQMAVDTGVSYLLSNSVQIDTAIVRGLNHKTPETMLAVGLSFKL
jgi:hypothetical protein